MPTPEFVLRLREKIGHDLIWMPGVTGVVLDENAEQVLLALRADSHRWSLISGILEPGEQPIAGLLREIREETGVDAIVERLSSCWSGQPAVVPTNGDRVQFLDLTFRCRYAGGTPHAADDENLEVRWFPVDELPESMRPVQRERLEHALAPDAPPYFRT